MSSGALAVWVDAAPEAEADFNDWYTSEHVPERVDIPGFRSGARYRAISGHPRYLAWYEAESVEVLRSPAYLERLNNPTPWTRRIMPSFRNTVRSVFEVRARRGRGRGGVAATIRLPSRLDGRGEAGGQEREAMSALLDLDGIVGAQLWTAAGSEGAETAETGLRGPDAVSSAAVLIEATNTDAARRACRDWLTAVRLREAGIRGRPSIGIYRLLYALEAH